MSDLVHPITAYDANYQECAGPSPGARVLGRSFGSRVVLTYDDGVHVFIPMPDELAQGLSKARKKQRLGRAMEDSIISEMRRIADEHTP